MSHDLVKCLKKINIWIDLCMEKFQFKFKFKFLDFFFKIFFFSGPGGDSQKTPRSPAEIFPKWPLYDKSGV